MTLIPLFHNYVPKRACSVLNSVSPEICCALLIRNVEGGTHLAKNSKDLNQPHHTDCRERNLP